MIKKNSISAKNIKAVRAEVRDYLKATTRPRKIKEAYGSTSSNEDAGFRPVTGNTVDRDLSPVTQDKMQNIAAWLYDSDPIAKRIIDLKRDFLVGEPVIVKAVDEDVDKVVQEFWKDPINNMDLFVPDIARDLGLFGEQAIPAFVNSVNGHVRLGYIDPCMIEKIIVNPDNCRESIGLTTKKLGDDYSELTKKDETFIAKWRAGQGVPEAIKSSQRTYKIVSTNRNPNDQENFEKLEGDVFYFAINKVTNATRGRSDLLALADWIHNYETFLFNRIERARILNCFLWDVELQGMNPKQIEDWMAKQGLPRPGSIRAHNEKVKWTTVSPQLESSDASNEAGMFRSHIAGGAGIPVHWLGGGEGLTRATALEMSTPVFKHLKQRQLYLKFILESMVSFVIDRAIVAGVLKKDVNKKFALTFPALSQKDLLSLANTLTGIASSLVLAKDAKLITPEEASKHLRMVLNLLGGDISAPASGPGMEPDEGVGIPDEPGVDGGIVQEATRALYNKTKRRK